MPKPKKSFVLRVNAQVWSALEKWADDEFRSVNGQLEYVIAEALKRAHRYPKALAADSELAESAEPTAAGAEAPGLTAAGAEAPGLTAAGTAAGTAASAPTVAPESAPSAHPESENRA